jgi:cell wall-associated NlpC family hydrolase
MINKKEVSLKVAWRMWGLPYIWGGDDTLAGFDCSGMCVEILKSSGVLPRKGDWTADGLYRKFKNNKVSGTFAGCLVFWGNDTRMTHVEFIIEPHHTIGASGGGRMTLTWRDAVNQNAYIKVRPVRPGYKAVVDPFMY